MPRAPQQGSLSWVPAGPQPHHLRRLGLADCARRDSFSAQLLISRACDRAPRLAGRLGVVRSDAVDRLARGPRGHRHCVRDQGHARARAHQIDTTCVCLASLAPSLSRRSVQEAAAERGGGAAGARARARPHTTLGDRGRARGPRRPDTCTGGQLFWEKQQLCARARLSAQVWLVPYGPTARPACDDGVSAPATEVSRELQLSTAVGPHPNVLRAVASWEDEEQLCVASRYAEQGDLFNVRDAFRGGLLPEALAAQIMLQACRPPPARRAFAGGGRHAACGGRRRSPWQCARATSLGFCTATSRRAGPHRPARCRRRCRAAAAPSLAAPVVAA